MTRKSESEFNPFIPTRKWNKGQIELAYGHHKLSPSFVWHLSIGSLTFELTPEQFDDAAALIAASDVWMKRK